MIMGTIRLVVAVLEVTSVRKMVHLDAATEVHDVVFRILGRFYDFYIDLNSVAGSALLLPGYCSAKEASPKQSLWDM